MWEKKFFRSLFVLIWRCYTINNNLHKFTDLKEGTDYDQITGNRYGWNLTSASADRSEFPVSLCHLLKRSKGHRLSHAKDALPVRNSKADCSFFVKCLSKREAWYHCAYQTWVSAAGTQPCFSGTSDLWKRCQKSPLCPKYGTDDPGAFMWCERTASFTFPKTPCRSSKCILQTPRLFVLPTPVSMQRSFHQNPPKGRSDASGPITWYCKIWDCLHRGLRKWSEYVWGFRNEVCHGQCRWDSEKRSRSYASGLRS